MFKKKLLKDISFTFVAQLAIMVIAFVINKIISVELGVNGYGQYSLIKKSSAVISFIILSGMGIALPKYLSLYSEKKERLKTIITIKMAILLVAIVGFFTITILFFLKPYVINYIIGHSTVVSDTNMFYVVIFYSVSQTLITFLLSMYRGLDMFLKYSIYQVIIQLLLLLLSVCFGYDIFLIFLLWGVATMTFVLVLTSLDFRNLIFEKNRSNKKISKSIFKRLLLFGLPRTGGDFLLFASTAVPLSIISYNLNDQSVAYFSVGLMFISIITPLFSLVGTALLPFVSRLFASKEIKEINRTVRLLSYFYILLSLLAILILSVFMDYLISLFFTQEFYPAAKVSKILILGILPYSLYLLLRNPIDALAIIPYNTIALLISFLFLLVSFSYSKTLIDYAISYVLADCLKGITSIIIWKKIKKTS